MSTRSKDERKPKGKRFSVGDVIIGIILIAIIWAAYSFLQPANPANRTTTSSSNIGPDFTLPVIDRNGPTGQSISLSSYRGKVVLLEFMAPQCVHCQRMTLVLEQLYSKYGGENVVLLSISGQGSQWFDATPADVASFIRTYGTNWPYLIDTSNSVFNAYGVTGTPTFFIIGKNGQVATSYVGETEYATLASDISRLLAS